MGIKENLELMKTLDDAWNAGPNSPLWETFKIRHREDVKVYWPAQPLPTIGRHNHDVEATEFFKTFDNKLVNSPLQDRLRSRRSHMHRCRLDGDHERAHERGRWKDDPAYWKDS